MRTNGIKNIIYSRERQDLRRQIRDPLFLRFKDWMEIFKYWGKVEWIVAIIFSPIILPVLAFYSILCELSLFF